MKKITTLVLALGFMSTVEAKTIEFKTFLNFPIVVKTTSEEGTDLEEPRQDELEDMAKLACEYIGYTSDGKYQLNVLHDQGTRGPKEVYQLMKNGKFKEKDAIKVYSFKSVNCVLPEDLDCKTSHFDLTDLEYIRYHREDCK
jgi:hypothetical protein